MIWTTFLLGLAPLGGAPATLSPQDFPPAVLAQMRQVGGTFAIRARLAETVAGGPLEHAVVLVENGEITTVGEDLPIERGIAVIDLPDDWVVLPGLVNAYTRVGMDSRGYSDSRGNLLASAELYPSAEDYRKVLEAGVTTLGEYPAGNGIPGQAVAVRPHGATPAEMIVQDRVYLKILLDRASAGAKKLISDGFDKADDYLEKEAKNREKWEKEQEKRKKDEKKKEDEKKEGEEQKEEGADEKKGEGKDEKQESDEYVPLEPDPRVKPFLDLRAGTLKALVSIGGSSEYLHLLDAIGDEEFTWNLRIPITREIDVFEIQDRVVEKGCRVVFEPELSLHPGTMRQRNIPAEYARAGVPIVLIPRNDQVSSHQSWLRDVGAAVAAGLERQAAIRAMTQEPADLLGVGDRVGSIEKGKRANLVFLNGDPFEPGTKVMAVMLEGKLFSGEVDL